MLNTKRNNWGIFSRLVAIMGVKQATTLLAHDPWRTSYFACALALVSLSAYNVALAAGFDCNQATVRAEKLICLNEQLSELDELLNRQFQEAMKKAKDRKALLNEQKAWIKERNKCPDINFLQTAYENRLAGLKPHSSCPVQERDLLGHWVAKGEQDFEEMLFEIRDNERRFLSWRHHRPEMPGRWVLKECEVHIEHIDDPRLSFEYAVVKRSARGLQLRDIHSNETSSYMKTK